MLPTCLMGQEELGLRNTARTEENITAMLLQRQTEWFLGQPRPLG